MTVFAEVPISHIKLSQNDRQNYDSIHMQELAESIDKLGLLQPVILRPLPPDKFEIAAGFRRLIVCRDILGWETIPAAIDGDMSEADLYRVMWEENQAREDLNPMDEAKALRKRQAAFGLLVGDLAVEVRRSPGWVADRLSLLQLVPQAQHLIASGQMKVGFGLAMVNLEPNRQQIALKALAQAKTLVQFRQLCGQLQAAQASESLFDWREFMSETIRADEKQAAQASARRFPVADNLPPFPLIKGVALSIETYLADLLSAGLDDEAAVVGKVYEGLLASGNAFKPKSSPLDKDSGK